MGYNFGVGVAEKRVLMVAVLQNDPSIGFGRTPKPYWCESFEITAQFKKEGFLCKIGLRFFGVVFAVKRFLFGAFPRRRPSDRGWGNPEPYRGEAFEITVQFKKEGFLC